MARVLISWMFIFFLHEGASNIICPDVAELDSQALLSCPISGSEAVIYQAPKNIVATCFSDRPSCVVSGNLKRFKGTVVNETNTYLEISDVQLSDEGSWKCEVQNREGRNKHITTNCTLELIKTPSCNITRYTSGLNVGDEITLSVNIQKYYCSSSFEMLLVTGKATHQLIENTTVKSIQSKTINSTFMLTDSHFGSVAVDFICNNVLKKVPCQGESVLVKHIPGDKIIAIIAGAASAAVFVIVIVIIVVCVVKKRRKAALKDNYRCTDGADNNNIRPGSMSLPAQHVYDEITDDLNEPRKDVEMIPMRDIGPVMSSL